MRLPEETVQVASAAWFALWWEGLSQSSIEYDEYSVSSSREKCVDQASVVPESFNADISTGQNSPRPHQMVRLPKTTTGHEGSKQLCTGGRVGRYSKHPSEVAS